MEDGHLPLPCVITGGYSARRAGTVTSGLSDQPSDEKTKTLLPPRGYMNSPLSSTFILWTLEPSVMQQAVACRDLQLRFAPRIFKFHQDTRPTCKGDAPKLSKCRGIVEIAMPSPSICTKTDLGNLDNKLCYAITVGQYCQYYIVFSLWSFNTYLVLAASISLFKHVQ